jgi:hypothetical protein
LEEALDLSSDRILNEMNGDKHVLSIAGTEWHKLVYHHVTTITGAIFPELLGIL